MIFDDNDYVDDSDEDVPLCTKSTPVSRGCTIDAWTESRKLTFGGRSQSRESRHARAHATVVHNSDSEDEPTRANEPT